MTPRMSVRARAREVYGEMAQGLARREGASEAAPLTDPLPEGERGQKEAAPTPNPSPLPASAGGGGEQEARERGQAEQAAGAGGDPPSQGSGAASLTARIRALYETSAVPVREIARIAGVTERTLYRYVEKGGWKRRYACTARDEAVAAANRGRRWQVAHGRAGDCAPAKGAGGRFIRREDIGKPYPTGLKALDPVGRSQALAACGQAQRLSRAAQRKAKAEARAEALIRALDFNARRWAGLRRHREAYVKGRSPSALHLRIEGLLIGSVEWSVRRLQALAPPGPAPASAVRQQPTPPPSRATSPPPSRFRATPDPRFDPDDYRAWLVSP